MFGKPAPQHGCWEALIQPTSQPQAPQARSSHPPSWLSPSSNSCMSLPAGLISSRHSTTTSPLTTLLRQQDHRRRHQQHSRRRAMHVLKRTPRLLMMLTTTTAPKAATQNATAPRTKTPQARKQAPLSLKIAAAAAAAVMAPYSSSGALLDRSETGEDWTTTTRAGKRALLFYKETP